MVPSAAPLLLSCSEFWRPCLHCDFIDFCSEPFSLNFGLLGIEAGALELLALFRID